VVRIRMCAVGMGVSRETEEWQAGRCQLPSLEDGR